MTAPAAVVVCALELLGSSASTLPPIELVETPPPEASARANGFVRRGVPIIFLVTSSSAFSTARCENRTSLLHLASVIVHEAWHVRHGSDERGAYDAQLGALLRLGLTPNHYVYRNVYRSMRTVLQAQKEREERRARALEEARAGDSFQPPASKPDATRADSSVEDPGAPAGEDTACTAAAAECAAISQASHEGCP